MKIVFISVGRMKNESLRDAASEYLKRIRRYAPVEAVEVKDEKAPAKAPREDVTRGEAQRIIAKLMPGDYVVSLADTGTGMTSAGLSELLSGIMASGRKRLVFIVGGAWGLHKDVYDRSQMVLSLSAMTLPHDLARLVLYEQVYRGFTIMRNEPYSH